MRTFRKNRLPLGSIRIREVSSTFSRDSDMPFLLHVISGCGAPSALQKNVTFPLIVAKTVLGVELRKKLGLKAKEGKKKKYFRDLKKKMYSAINFK